MYDEKKKKKEKKNEKKKKNKGDQIFIISQMTYDSEDVYSWNQLKGEHKQKLKELDEICSSSFYQCVSQGKLVVEEK